MIWTRPKHLTIWTVQNHFGPIEGQGIEIIEIKQ